MILPRLHVITDDRVLGRSDFEATAAAIMHARGGSVAVHVRGHETPVRRLYRLAEALADAARQSGAALLVNGRADIALALPGTGLQVGGGALPVGPSRTLLGPGPLIGSSAHGVDEAVSALERGADFVLLGTIWETESHPGRPGAGLDRVRSVVTKVTEPIVAIGGVTAGRAADVIRAGGYGAAACRGIWEASDPVSEAGVYLDRMEAALDDG